MNEKTGRSRRPALTVTSPSTSAPASMATASVSGSNSAAAPIGSARARDGARRTQSVSVAGMRRGSDRGDGLTMTEPRRAVGTWAFLLAIVTAGALSHVGVRFKGLEVAYALGRERKVSVALEEQRRRLQIEIGMLKDPNRVVSIARDQLKMGPPAPEAIRRLGTGALFAAPSPPSPSPSLPPSPSLSGGLPSPTSIQAATASASGGRR